MKQTFTLKEKYKLFFKIFYPLLFTQVTYLIISLIDTIMAGRFSSIDLAGVAIGSSIWFSIQFGLLGILSAFTPVVANMLGAKKGRVSIRNQVIQTIYFAIVIGLFSILIVLLFFPIILNFFSVEQEVGIIATDYVRFLMIGVIPQFVYMICRNFFDVHGKTNISMLLSLAILPINTIFNYLYIFGIAFFPKLGGAGTGIGTSICYWMLCITSIIILQKHKLFKKYHLFKHWHKISFSYWRPVFKIGLPIGLTVFAEASCFGIITLLLSSFPPEVIAAHQSSINFISLLFMVPYSIALALTITIGYEYGAKRLADARSYEKIGIIFSVSFALFSSLVLFFLRPAIANLYSTETIVKGYIVQFLIYGMIFQFSDGLQAILQGILRGYKDVNSAMYISLICYYVIGIPSGFVFANHTSLGPFGYWVGFIAGLTACAIGLSMRLNTLRKGTLSVKVPG